MTVEEETMPSQYSESILKVMTNANCFMPFKETAAALWLFSMNVKGKEQKQLLSLQSQTIYLKQATD